MFWVFWYVICLKTINIFDTPNFFLKRRSREMTKKTKRKKMKKKNDDEEEKADNWWNWKQKEEAINVWIGRKRKNFG